MKRIYWCTILFFFVLVCDERSFAQERKYSDSEILEQMRREGIDKILPILGSREISVKRHFENYKYPIQRSKNWDIVHSKAIIVGVVEKVTDLEAYSGYGTEVAIAVRKVLKGRVDNEVITVKLASGRRLRLTPENRSMFKGAKGSRVIISQASDPKFHENETVLLSLSELPLRLHSFTYYALTKNPAFVDKQSVIDDWYKTKINGFYEIGPLDKIKINPNHLSQDTSPLIPWYGSFKSLVEVEEEIKEIIQNQE